MKGVSFMKKYLSIALIVSLLFGMISCNETSQKGNNLSVTFYKDGSCFVSTDEQLNDQILQDIIDEFDGQNSRSIMKLLATTDLIREMKRTEMAIEIQINEAIDIDNPVVKSTTKTLFIPLTGEYDYMIFNNTFEFPDNWSGPVAGGKGLEKYFENITFTPLTEEEKRWQSTIETPEIKFYEKGVLIGESEDFDGLDLNYRIASHIETWFYKKDDIKTVNVQFSESQKPWGDVNYVELSYNYKTKFYGEEIIKEEYYWLTIPLEGEYAYHIFTANFEGYSDIAYVPGGSGLERFFEEFKANNNG